MTETSTRLRKVAVGAGVAAGTSAVAGGLGHLAGAAYFARRVLTPDRRRPDDVVIRSVGRDTVTLTATPDTVVPGRYGLWLDEGRGHARVGDRVDDGSDPASVTRQVLALDAGFLAPGPARWNAYFWGAPPEESLGLRTHHLSVRGELGPLPTWVVPPAEAASTPAADRWAILVHGRGARREEALRAIGPLHRLGWTCMVPSYRNDEGVVAGPGGRYTLGLSEWRDIEAAVDHAARLGAQEIMLMGWSMGGAIVLQFLDRSALSQLVDGIVLDGPVIDWGDVLAHHGRLHHVPATVLGLSRAMMGRRWGKRLVGVQDVLDVAQTDWVTRSGELGHPVLLIHSADDEFVPVGPSRALAKQRPDLVRYEEFTVARHCKEWNVDPQRWERVLGEFAGGLSA